MKKYVESIGIAILAVFLIVGISEARSFEELYDSYFGEETPEYVSPKIEQREVEDLWYALKEESDAKARADIGLSLLEKTVNGDPSGWNLTEGFVGPEGYPLPVTVFQTTLITISSLYEVDDGPSIEKANSLAQTFLGNRNTLRVLQRSSGNDVLETRKSLRNKDILQVRNYLEGYDSRELQFNIALLRKVRGNIREYNAWSRNMIFLNNSGQVTNGIGRYAWDWQNGKVYRIIDKEDNSIGAFANRPSTPSPGGGDDDDDNAGNPGEGDDDDDDSGGPVGDDDDDDDDNGGPVGDDDDDDDDNGGPGNGNGNNGNPGNGGGNNNGSGPGSGNNGNNNGQGNGFGNGGGGSGNQGNNGNGNGNNGSGPGNGNGNAGNPGNGGGNNNGSGPGSGNNGNNNGQGNGSGNGGDGSGNQGNNGNGNGNTGSGPGNGNGNAGNPGNGGGNNNGSGPGSGNNGSNNGQDGNTGNGGSRSGLGDGTNPGGGSDNNNAGDSSGGSGTENPGVSS